MLSTLIKHQQASVVIRPYEWQGGLGELQGELSIVVKGEVHTFEATGRTTEQVEGGLEREYLKYDWSKTDTPVVIVAIHGGLAEVIDSGGCNVIVANYDNLPGNGCPACGLGLGETGQAERLCPECGFIWEESDE